MILLPEDRVEEFKAWIKLHGGEVQPSNSEWEVVRWFLGHGRVSILYKNKKGQQSGYNDAEKHIEAFLDGRTLHKRPKNIPSKVKRTVRQALAERDGLECWFCRCTESELTLEHLLARSNGGSNDLANLVMACEPCNKEIGNMPIVDKIAWRDACRRVAPGQVWDDDTDPNWVPWIESEAA